MTEGYVEEYGIAYRSNEILPSRKTLVFIHGLSGSASAWIHFEEKLNDEFNIVTYDLRGHGLSKRYTHFNDYELERFAEDLAHLLSYLKINSCSLVAHSFGTIIAVDVLRINKSITSVVFLSINYRIKTVPRVRLTLPFLIVATSLLRILPFAPRKGKRIDYSNFIYSPDWSFQRIYPEIKDLTLRIYLYCLRQIYQYKETYWNKIIIPTLLIHGNIDTFAPMSLAILAQKEIPGSELKIIKGANHMLVINNVPEIVGAIKDFIK